jgi:hypothetical protein
VDEVVGYSDFGAIYGFLPDKHPVLKGIFYSELWITWPMTPSNAVIAW